MLDVHALQREAHASLVLCALQERLHLARTDALVKVHVGHVRLCHLHSFSVAQQADFSNFHMLFHLDISYTVSPRHFIHFIA